MQFSSDLRSKASTQLHYAASDDTARPSSNVPQRPSHTVPSTSLREALQHQQDLLARTSAAAQKSVALFDEYLVHSGRLMGLIEASRSKEPTPSRGEACLARRLQQEEQEKTALASAHAELTQTHAQLVEAAGALEQKSARWADKAAQRRDKNRRLLTENAELATELETSERLRRQEAWSANLLRRQREDCLAAATARCQHLEGLVGALVEQNRALRDEVTGPAGSVLRLSPPPGIGGHSRQGMPEQPSLDSLERAILGAINGEDRVTDASQHVAVSPVAALPPFPFV